MSIKRESELKLEETLKCGEVSLSWVLSLLVD